MKINYGRNSIKNKKMSNKNVKKAKEEAKDTDRFSYAASLGQFAIVNGA